MKMITEKQKKFINDIKGVITENGINAIDALDLNKFTNISAGMPTIFRCGMKAQIFLNLSAKLKKKVVYL